MAWVAARLATLERITAEDVTRSTACALRHALTDDPRLLAALRSRRHAEGTMELPVRRRG
ncbi:MAG: hypothetical protein MUC63_10685 [Planctomycetes bacterium]|nr:hypothetical protein [Planctomycetota bacterium]